MSTRSSTRNISASIANLAASDLLNSDDEIEMDVDAEGRGMSEQEDEEKEEASEDEEDDEEEDEEYDEYEEEEGAEVVVGTKRKRKAKKSDKPSPSKIEYKVCMFTTKQMKQVFTHAPKMHHLGQLFSSSIRPTRGTVRALVHVRPSWSDTRFSTTPPPQAKRSSFRRAFSSRKFSNSSAVKNIFSLCTNGLTRVTRMSSAQGGGGEVQVAETLFCHDNAEASSSRTKRKRDEKRMQEVLEAEDLDSDGNPVGTRPKKAAKAGRRSRPKGRVIVVDNDPDDENFTGEESTESDDEPEVVMSNGELADSLPTKRAAVPPRKKASAAKKAPGKNKGKSKDNDTSTSGAGPSKPAKKHFFEQVNADTDGSQVEGAKYWKCRHGNRMILKMTSGMKHNNSKLQQHLEKNFTPLYRLFLVLLKRDSPPTPDELALATQTNDASDSESGSPDSAVGKAIFKCKGTYSFYVQTVRAAMNVESSDLRHLRGV
ncbi:hypothetical protein B0H13DRAFT_1854793 [Mycena leptocephala]|nr:hypothetical protein B0H13DRAFT_1854793 [Mycena leptocephala]